MGHFENILYIMYTYMKSQGFWIHVTIVVYYVYSNVLRWDW